MSALAGKRIVITRAAHQAAEFERLLRERGADPLLYPCIDIAPPQDSAPLDRALHEAASGVFGWLVLTSSNTVQAVASRLDALGLTLSTVRTIKVAAVGPATAEAAERLLGVEVSAIPEIYTAEALAGTMQFVNGERVFLPQSAIAEDKLARALTGAGANVTAVEAYQTVVGSGGVDLPALLEVGRVDAITFTSPSTVKNLLRRFESEGGSPAPLDNVCVACIGTETAAAARELGLSVEVVAREHTLSGLTIALEDHFERIRST